MAAPLAIDPLLMGSATDVQEPPHPAPQHPPDSPRELQHSEQRVQHSEYESLPGVAGSNDANDAVAALSADLSNAAKRPRACEACRGLKVRCDFDPDLPDDAPCKRCAKAKRFCAVTQPSRKRQKKADTRVAELERKIDALTATLQAKNGSPLQAGAATSIHPATGPVQPDLADLSQNNPYTITYSPWLPRTFDPANNKYDQRLLGGDWEPGTALPSPTRADSELRKAVLPSLGPPLKRRRSDTQSAAAGRHDKNDLAQNGGVHNRGAQVPAVEADHDAISRGLLTMEMAERMFTRYTDRMAIDMPAVVFASGTSMMDVRTSKPVLWLAIMAAASGVESPDLQRTLVKEVMAAYGERIIGNGEKTLELIQALLVSCIWYWPPEHFEELKFYQLIHLAAVMAIDLNLNRRAKTPGKKPFVVAAMFGRRTPFPDAAAIESRRVWLACYFLCASTAMGLRRQNLIRWSSYLDECLVVLETSEEALPSDKALAQWVRSQRIAEEVGETFSMDDPWATVSIQDQKVQHSLKGFERNLEIWSHQVPVECRSPVLKMTEHVLELYMHEIAMHVDHNVEEFKPPFTEETLRGERTLETSQPLSSVHINALSTCLSAIDGVFTNFLAIDVEGLRCLPVMHFVRLAYAVVVLIKMYFAAAIEGSELGKVIATENMKVEYYLDTLLDHFRAAAAEDKSRPSTKILMVLVMLRTWFHRQKAGKIGSGENQDVTSTATASASSASSSHAAPQVAAQRPSIPMPQSQQAYGPANTPLHLLSEVATGAQSRHSEPRFSDSPQNWQQNPLEVMQQQYNYSSQIQQLYGAAPPPHSLAVSSTAPSYAADANVDPSLSMMGYMGMDFNAGDGFEQAMGMTLGEGDFNFFSDDAFFGAVMESAGAKGPSAWNGFG